MHWWGRSSCDPPCRFPDAPGTRNSTLPAGTIKVFASIPSARQLPVMDTPARGTDLTTESRAGPGQSLGASGGVLATSTHCPSRPAWDRQPRHPGPLPQVSQPRGGLGWSVLSLSGCGPGHGWRRTRAQGWNRRDRGFYPTPCPLEGEENEVLQGHQANLNMGPGDSAFGRLGRDRKGGGGSQDIH